MSRWTMISRIRSTPLRRLAILATFPLMFLINTAFGVLMMPYAIFKMNAMLLKTAILRWSEPLP